MVATSADILDAATDFSNRLDRHVTLCRWCRTEELYDAGVGAIVLTRFAYDIRIDQIHDLA